ncbi:MAG: RNA methyltransferase [Clostridiales bacterium]|nr:RNA methyltransferase [Clostridiales bacterium]
MRKRKNRQQDRCFFIEGLKSAEEAITAKTSIKNIVVSENFMKSENYNKVKKLYSSTYRKSVELCLLPVSDNIYNFLTETETPQGIGVLAAYEDHILRDEIVPGGKYLLMENIQDPGNVGTIIRTCDAAAFNGVILTTGCADVYNSKTLRSTAGSVFHIPFYCVESVENVKPLLKAANMKIFSTGLRGGLNCFEADFSGGCVIIVGNESNGLTESALAACDQILTIPMPGEAESLNVSVAASLLVYAALI